MHWYLDVLKEYAVFSGRAGRKEYWLFALFNLIISFVLLIVDAAAGLADPETGLGLLLVVYTLAVIIPGTAVSVRRLHDTDHSGWWLLIALIPIVGAIVLLVFMVRDGEPGHNRFGPDPKESATLPVPVVAIGGVQGTNRADGHMQTYFCISCGTKLPEIAAYCPTCGTRRTA